MLSDVRLDAQPKDSFQLFHCDSSKKQRDEMVSCAHVYHLYWQFQPGKTRGAKRETQTSLTNSSFYSTASRLSHHISMLLSRKGCLGSPKSSRKIHHCLVSTWGTSYSKYTDPKKNQEDAKNSTIMPTPNFITHKNAHTHTHTPSNIWVNYNKNHLNLKLLSSFWRILFNDLFASARLHKIQAVTSNSWPSKDPATLVVLENVIPSDASQVDNGTLISQRNDEIATTSNVKMNESMSQWISANHWWFDWFGIPLDFFKIKFQRVCRLGGGTPTCRIRNHQAKPWNHMLRIHQNHSKHMQTYQISCVKRS